jgi:hypothetical protein
MNRQILKAAIGVLAVAALAVPASAQTTQPMGLSLRAGVVFPTAGAGRDVGRTWFGVGGEFRFMDANFGGPAAPGQASWLSASIDWYGKGNASAVPVLINWVGTANEFFYSVGAGVSFSREPGGTNRTGFGYQFGLGYNFQQAQMPLFIEAKFFGNSHGSLNALGIYAGVRL